ncbi:hypothetical protein D6792_00725 [Candidatus Parcubacteria bacterium]|nr:MAG: hypothetical protein D6792_00725 [Candidatus Parcubacteria bacterium]
MHRENLRRLAAVENVLRQHPKPCRGYHQGRLVYQKGFGHADIASKAAVAPQTAFASLPYPNSLLFFVRREEKQASKVVFGADPSERVAE